MAAKRQRGVKASRLKLEHYMLAAGIKSQAELARKMADLENLDTEPKDLVNRVFRQNKVEHHSLERVAKALDVEAYKLYLTQEDEQLIQQSTIVSSEPNLAHQDVDAMTSPEHSAVHRFEKRKNYVLMLTFFLLLPLFYLVYTLTKQNDKVHNNATDYLPIVEQESEQNSLLFPKQLSLYPLANYLAEQQNGARIGIVPRALFNDFEVTSESLRKYEVDVIWTIAQKDLGRYSTLFVSQLKNNEYRLVSAISFSQNELRNANAMISQHFTQLIQSPKALLTGVQQEHVRQDSLTLVKARQLVEHYFSADNMKQAEALLNQLHRQTAESLAISCLIKVNIGWHSDEKAAFEQAQTLCDRALMLDSSHPFVLSTNAYRLYRNGQYEDAVRAYNILLDQFPENIEGLLGKAELSLRYYLQDPEQHKASINASISYAQQAILQEPDYWRGYQLLGTVYYLAKQPKQALEVMKKLNQLAPNQLSLANAAILSLCHEEMDDAQTYANEMLTIDANSYIAHETRFFVYAYQNQLSDALAAMQEAMNIFENQQGGLHMQWGQLADAFRWNRDIEQAKAHYKKALIEFEQDKIKQQTTDNDIIYPLFYQAAIDKLSQQNLSQNLTAELSHLSVDNMPSAQLLKTAVLYRWLGEATQAAQIEEKLIATCPVYQHAVDLN